MEGSGRSQGAALPLGDVAGQNPELNLALGVGGRRGRVRFFTHGWDWAGD